MSLILDSSVALAWILSEETTPAVQRVFQEVAASHAWAPSLWRLEIANVLEMGVRRGRHSARFRDDTLEDLAQLPIRTDPETERHAWGATLRLASRHKLTVYDAAYLELALRRDLPLATLDAELRAAATQQSVTLLGA
ncbi:MAG TPA: type II toxin-antitoxin system VapC family toxin [Acidobacteriaceae bacterium]|nr:type II toxin-antitoxin system VapC family toxin [Acidobacteriaceae bacterium]